MEFTGWGSGLLVGTMGALLRPGYNATAQPCLHVSQWPLVVLQPKSIFPVDHRGKPPDVNTVTYHSLDSIVLIRGGLILAQKLTFFGITWKLETFFGV